MKRFILGGIGKMKKIENELDIITEKLSQEAGIPFKEYQYKSICRVNVLQKFS